MKIQKPLHFSPDQRGIVAVPTLAASMLVMLGILGAWALV